jgi:hypothetical protein
MFFLFKQLFTLYKSKKYLCAELLVTLVTGMLIPL